MKIGVLLPTREQVLFGDADGRAVVQDAVDAEESGFDSVWVSDSLLARPRFDPLTLASAIAAQTESVGIGIAVLLPALRHPLLLAQAIATVDQIAMGRLIVGVGAGSPIPANQAEFEALEIPFDERVGRRDRAVRVCRRLWSGNEVGSKRYWDFNVPKLQPMPYQPGGPPIWLGGEAPRTLERAGELYDGWIPHTPSADTYGVQLTKVHDAAARAGREPSSVEAALYVTITLHSDPRRAEEIQREYLEAYYELPYEILSSVHACHAGSVESAIEWIQGYVAQGARHIVLRSGVPSADGQVERLREVREVLKSMIDEGASR
jgi:alkanesulfonate monooxygenase SsuD/methylene tetrahydromethanopterin reductase-like flavin-dependent oxidoreductase (luciferase family)